MDWWQLALDTRDWFAKWSLEDIRNLVLSCAGAVGMPYLVYRTGIAAKQAKTSENQLAATMEISRQAAEHNRKGQNLDRFRNGVAMLAAGSPVEKRGGIQVLLDLAREAPDEYLLPVQTCFCEVMPTISPTGIGPGGDFVVVVLEAFAELREAWALTPWKFGGKHPRIRGVNFSGCDLHWLKLNQVTFENCDFTAATMRGCNFDLCFMFKCKFARVKYQVVEFDKCSFLQCREVDASADGFRMREEDKPGLVASGARMYNPTVPKN